MSINRAVIIHGTYGSPEGNWFPWLANELRQRNLEVLIPHFPTPEGQTLENWLAVFRKEVGELTPQTILIGHSMGAGMICRVLEKNSIRIGASVLVSGWEGLLDSEEFDPLIKSFYLEPFDYQTIKNNLGTALVYHGTDDPYVPISMAQEFAANLETELTEVANGGHLNAESGYLEFPLLLQDIEKLI